MSEEEETFGLMTTEEALEIYNSLVNEMKTLFYHYEQFFMYLFSHNNLSIECTLYILNVLRFTQEQFEGVAFRANQMYILFYGEPAVSDQSSS